MCNIHKWDVVCPLNTSIQSDSTMEELKRAMQPQTFTWSLGTPNQKDIIILGYHPMNIIFSKNDPLYRFSRIDFSFEEEEITCVKIYAPIDHKEQAYCFKNMCQILVRGITAQEFDHRADFNCLGSK